MISSLFKETMSDVNKEINELPASEDIEGKVESYEEADKPLFEQKVDRNEVIAENRERGDAREKQVFEELSEQYPPEEGCKIIPEAYLRDSDGNIVKDSETGQARRIDFVVEKDGEIVDSVEVTSETASKDSQMAKEGRIRENGGNFIKDPETGELYEMPSTTQTTVRRLE